MAYLGDKKKRGGIPQKNTYQSVRSWEQRNMYTLGVLA